MVNKILNTIFVLKKKENSIQKYERKENEPKWMEYEIITAGNPFL